MPHLCCALSSFLNTSSHRLQWSSSIIIVWSLWMASRPYRSMSWGVFALDAEKNWFKTNTFHLTVCSKMKMKFCREIPETFQLRREWRNVNKNEETRSYSFALFNLTLSIKITKGGLDIDHSHSYSFSYINSYIFPLSIIRITLTCYSKMNQEAFIRSLIPRVCCDGISICQGKLITEIMGKKHQPFFRLFLFELKRIIFLHFF